MSERTETDAPYDLSAVLDVDAARAIHPGTSLLVAGPAMVGKESFVVDAIADGLGDGEGAVAVTTGGSATDLLDEFEHRVDGLDHTSVGVVDCRADGNRQSRETDDGSFVQHVGSPSDLTGLGIGITESFERLQESGVERARLGLASLSTLLTYTDRQTVFKFCHVLSSRLDNAGFLGLFTVDSAAHGGQTLQVIKQAFDGLIEVRTHDGSRQARVFGVQPDPSEWIEL